MAKQTHEILAFNRGVVSPLLMGRLDIQRTALSAAIQSNFVPHSLGPMSLRPGLEFIGGTRGFAQSKHIPFVFSNTDTALLELTDRIMRVRPLGGALITVPPVSTTLTNGNFAVDISGWTDASIAGIGTASWVDGNAIGLPTGGYLRLRSPNIADGAKITQTQTPILADLGIEHRLRVVVSMGEIVIQVSSPGNVEHARVVAPTGVYSIAFTPTTAFTVSLSTLDREGGAVDSAVIETVAILEIPTPWPKSVLLNALRYTQSGDVVYVAANGIPPYTISRGLNNSWSVAELRNTAGPFRAENTTQITMGISVFDSDYGVTQLVASSNYFTPSHVGGLFSVTSPGQGKAVSAAGAIKFTQPIEVTGAGVARDVWYNIALLGGATGVLQRAVGSPSAWTTIVSTAVDIPDTMFNDGLDNQTVYYRTGSQAPVGSILARVFTASGTTIGVGKIIIYLTPTTVQLETLAQFGIAYSVPAAFTPRSAVWSEGSWSEFRGYPSATVLRDGRLWFAGEDRVWASVVDDFANFDPNYPGDAGPINRSIGEGPVESLGWMVSSQQLIVGGGAAEWAIRSTSRDEPITPFNFNIRPASSLGSSLVDAVALDTSIIYVDKSGSRVIEFTSETGNGGTPSDLTLLAPQIGLPGVINLAVQRRPDARIHAVRSDGKVAMLLTSKTEDVRAWAEIGTDGFIEEAVVLPGTEEDQVFYVVQRDIAGVGSVRYLEKWAKASECLGGLVNKQADSFFLYNGPPATVIGGINTLGHLEGAQVSVWADGVDRGLFTVSGFTVTLPIAVSAAVIGLPYTARFKSTKLARSPAQLVSRKRISKLSVLLANTHAQGLRYGDSFSALDPMPLIEEGGVVDPNFIWGDYNYDSFGLNGTFTVDSRLCLEAASPRPCTVLAVVIDMEE